ncbi:MAG: hypothetical protein M1142_03710 [Patescibacteria group bacterium]|nr:hypothetical protein [Patescibacteria group bacterium]
MNVLKLPGLFWLLLFIILSGIFFITQSASAYDVPGVYSNSPDPCAEVNCNSGFYCSGGSCVPAPCSDTSQSCAFTNGQFTYSNGSGNQFCRQDRGSDGQCYNNGTCGACHATCSTARNIPYCEGDNLYETSQCARDFGASGSTITDDRDLAEDCTTHGQRTYPNNPELWSDWHCRGEIGSAKCEREYKMEASINPDPQGSSDPQSRPPFLGEPETFTMKGTNSCKPPDPTKDFTPDHLGNKENTIPNDGFVDTSLYKQFDDKTCFIRYTDSSCNPNGGTPCTWTVTCVPTTMSQNINDTRQFTFQTTHINLVSDRYGNDCLSYPLTYAISARYCNLSDTTTIKDTNGNTDQQVIGPTLNDDANITRVMSHSLLPQALNNDLDKTATPSPEIGVQTGFFWDLNKLICSAQSLFKSIPIIGGLASEDRWFCASKVNLANQTQYFTQASQALALAQRPAQLTPVPMKKSCYLEDLTQKNTVGNKDLDTLDTSLATNSGNYVLGLPDFPLALSSNSAKPTDLQLYQLRNGSNLSLQQKVFKEDDRPPDINCGQEVYYKASFPQGTDGQIKPLYQPLPSTVPCIPSPTPK